MMFLTVEEVRELTGYVMPAAQCRWLQKRGWKFERSAAHGRPIVLRKHVEEMLSLDVANKEPTRPEPKMNLEWLKKKGK